ncbi:MAG TPA: hypothetical protein VE591_02700 [Candidatus Acidoferrum sp.]|nr:hypothetical protein [Candidatus Acidoferrum sp.]
MFLALALFTAPLAARGADTPATPAPSPSAAEATFLATVMRELPKRYPNPAAATKAGYVRYSNEDRTGAISYVNIAHWDVTDPAVPAQLWYDVNGRLLGADYSVKQADAPNGPSLFGIDPKRFGKIRAHVHYVLCDKTTSKCTYGKAVGAAKYTAAGGDVEHPTAEGLVKAGAVSDPASVSTVFLYPAIYDVTVWVVPDPLGQFADTNPNVKPSAMAGKGEEM